MRLKGKIFVKNDLEVASSIGWDNGVIADGDSCKGSAQCLE